MQPDILKPSRFYAFVNRSRSLARVHREDCGSCNRGRGLHGGGRTAHGWWSEPLDTLDEALAYARKHQPGDARPCMHCLRDLRSRQV